MNLYQQIKIISNPNLYQYLRENSYWYKYLYRDPNSIIRMENEMKEKYKLRISDKVNHLSKRIDTISTLLDVFK